MFASALWRCLPTSLLFAITLGCSSSNPVGPSRPDSPGPGPLSTPERLGRPSIASLSADPGSTGGGASFTIAGTGFQTGSRVSFGGVRTSASLFQGELLGMTPAHAAGSVDVTVTNPDGQSDTLTGGYTYVEPSSLDFNGDWEGYGTEGETSLRFTIRNNALTAISCGLSSDAAPTLMLGLSPPPPVSTGTVTFSGSEGVFAGRIVTATSASGTLSFDRCFAGLAFWSAVKR